jgi:hypothetical protein
VEHLKGLGKLANCHFNKKQVESGKFQNGTLTKWRTKGQGLAPLSDFFN